MAIQPYTGRNAPRLKRNTPTFARRPDVPRGFPLVGNGLGGLPQRRTEPPDAWVLTVDITAGGQTWTVNISAGTGIAIVVDWGDGLIEPFSTTGQKNHTYNAPGRYFPRISGQFASGGNIRFGSNSGNRARLKTTSVIPFIPGLVSFQSTFSDCTGLTGSIPAGIFDNNTLVSTSGFRATFSSCTGLTAIPAGLFDKNTLVSTSGFYQTFSGCTGITAIPAGLFDKNTAVSTSGFQETFSGCTGITAIPAGLFDKNTLVSTSGFYQTFSGCTGLRSISSGLFDNNTLVSTSGFRATFYGCTGLTSIPSGLFDNNTAVSTTGFQQTFQGCTGLTSIPSGLFDKNTAVSTDGFFWTFQGCTGLGTLPALLFKNNTQCNSWQSCFQNCNKLQLRADLFWDPAGEDEHLTRFLNQSVDFTNAMSIGIFTGTQGTAPAMWTCSFGTGTPLKTSCFTGHTTSSIDNHAAVVADGTWGLS